MARFSLLAVLLVALAIPAVAQDASSEAPAVEAVEEHSADGEHSEAEPSEAEPHAEDDSHGATGDHGEDDHGDDHGHGPSPPVWLVIPFGVLLLMIATGPLFYPHFWHHHYPKVAIGLGALTAAYYFIALRAPGEAVPIAIVHAAEEYFSFIALLGALFVASGTILIKTDFAGTPRNNSILLFLGSVLSNFIGTTGASMLLIRPFMRLNAGRLKAYHIVFFIFTVSNVGGALTPIGDPPLFLGFLRGVPFFWTVTEVWFIWLPTILAIIAVFWVVDARNKTESIRGQAEGRGEDVEPGALPGSSAVPEAQGVEDVSGLHSDDEVSIRLSRKGPNPKALEIDGKMGFVWLAVVIASVFLDPNVFSWVPDLHELAHLPFGIREVIMLGVCVLAYRTAKPEALRGNDFNFEPIKEVGYLFIGIFLTMQPALTLIGNWARDNADTIGVTTFYYGTGVLSGVLDNAPTYVSFLSAAMGKFGLDVNVPADVAAFSAGTEMGFYLLAISVASVFFGALTYIGNGPNFMVKAIAESSGVQTPSFVAYIVKYSLPILIPIYVVVWAVFFSGWVLPTPIEAAAAVDAVLQDPSLLTYFLP
ncbi:MAG: sodium:proton antiporter [Bacteroidota bacterium]